MAYEKIELEPFLPSAEEMKNMSKVEFAEWISKAGDVIPQRIYQRDPLFDLNKKITSILESFRSDEEKERVVLLEIQRHYAEERLVKNDYRC